MYLSARLQCHQKWIKEELERSVRFWLTNGMDPVHGGVYTCLDREGKIFSTDKSVWMQGRCAWTFAYLCHVYGVRDEWLEASKSCLDFIIYNIPQLAGVALTMPLLRTMLKNPRVIGVKNSSMPVQDIQMFRDEGAIVFNGPDEQLLSGLAAGAIGGIGGIGGTYGAMPELYMKIRELYLTGNMELGREVQNECCRIIYKMCSAKGNMYAVIKAILRRQGGPDCGGVRLPLAPMVDSDEAIADECAAMIANAIAKYC